jgi:glycosyltransferase involved in cell wall biosynthesis
MICLLILGCMRPLRHLLLATLEDTSNPRSWSGIPYSLRQSLQSHLERLTVIDRLPVKRAIGPAILRLSLGGSPPRWPLWATNPALKQFGRLVREAVEANHPDAVLSLSSRCIIYYQPPVPFGVFCDAPWMAWKQSYRKYEAQSLNGKAFGRKEAMAARKCNAIIFSSQWAVDQGRRLYGESDCRFYVAPLGATWVPNLTTEQLTEHIQKRDRDKLSLLFVGKDWERKGGPLAVEIARGLNGAGIPTCLNIVGCNPSVRNEDRKFVSVHGFLSRDDSEHSRKLHGLFLDSHFLVVPTNAECFGIVFAEAAAHALPAVSKGVDAVPSIVSDDETGIVIDRNLGAEAYVRRIMDTFRDEARYSAMALAARERYRQNFTWDACAGRIIRALEEQL